MVRGYSEDGTGSACSRTHSRLSHTTKGGSLESSGTKRILEGSNPKKKAHHAATSHEKASNPKEEGYCAHHALFDNHDALTQLLVRVPAADHPSLRWVCKTFQQILDSESFRKERMLTECAEVTARPLTISELILDSNESYDAVYSDVGRYDRWGQVIQNEFRVHVDGKLAGSGRLSLVRLRGREGGFHDICHNGLVFSEGDLYFSDRGRPRPESVKQAMETTDKQWFLFIESFHLDKEYRQHTWVGAQAMRSLLCHSPLQNKWSICIYVGDYDNQIILQEDREKCTAFERLADSGVRLPDHLDEKELKQHFDSLSKLDLRQFLRCGFRQAPETISKSHHHHVYSVPSFFVEDAMMSHDAAMSIAILEKQRPSEPPTGVNAELFSLVHWACSMDEKSERESNKEGVKVSVSDFVRDNIQELLDMGATVENSNVLHGCAQYINHKFMELVLEFVPDRDRRTLINKPDEDGRTPLMHVASNFNREKKDEWYQMIDHLMELGADKNLTDVSGETALGKYRKWRQVNRHSTVFFEREKDHEHTEKLLMPFYGPTDADNAYLQNEESSDEESSQNDEGSDRPRG